MISRRQAFHLLAAAAMAAAAATLGCHDATAPSIEVLVSLAQVSGPTFSSDSSGFPVITCEIELSAQASGSGSATWTDARYYFYAGADRSQPVDSGVIRASTVRLLWGKSTISAGDYLVTGWGFSAGIPFSVDLAYGYQVPRGPSREAKVHFACGPDTLASTPPEIATFAVIPSSPPQPGDSLQLAFTASSAYGLLLTSLRVDGACTAQRTIVDSLKLSQVGPLTLALPATCPLGGQLTATVTAVDGLLRATARTIDLPPLVDLTPPVLAAQIFPRGRPWATSVLAGDFFTGDTIRLWVPVSDNQGLRTLLWEVQPAGFVDSTSISGLADTQTVRVPLQAGWAGPIQLRLYARDASGNTSAALQSAPGAITVYPTLGPVPAAGTVPGAIDDAWLDAARGVAYLLQGDSARIALYDPAAAAVTGTIALPGPAADMDLSPTGDSLIVLLKGAGSLVVVDLGTAPPAVTAVQGFAGGTIPQAGPGRVRVLANGQAMVVNDYDYHLFSITLATGATRMWTLPTLFGEAYIGLLERSLDHGAAVLSWVDYNGVGWVRRYDAATDTWSAARVQAVSLPAVDETGATIAVLDSLYDGSLTQLRSLRPWPWLDATVTALSPDGGTWNASDSTAGIVQVRTSDAHPLDRIFLPFTATRLRATPDGRYLLAVRKGAAASQVAVIDLTRLTAVPVRQR